MMLSAFLLLSLAAVSINAPERDKAEAVALARTTLARELEADAASFVLRGAEAVEWPDASLGCAAPGENPSARPTPGYRILFEEGRRLHRVHVGGGKARVCAAPTQPEPAASGKPVAGRVPPARPSVSSTIEVPRPILDAILADLAKRTGSARETLDVLRSEETVFPDGSLGCPKPGLAYTQALVEGYRVVIRHAGKDYDYRAARSGYFVLCER